jgi:hypothetical protein
MSNTTGHETGGAAAANEPTILISSDKVEGTVVYNGGGEKLGSVYNLMIDKQSGKVAYATMSFGGFLGIGSSYYPLPWSQLTYDAAKGGYVVNLSKEQFQGAPAHADTETPMWEDPAYRRNIDDFYSPLGGPGVGPL